ncbi:hypothetical protein POM88_040887 [Heracleum sosnowskyi]|uniref:Endonuclease/exonuclease/phosphatase domain-containing protein n=1 Tax=Heracleum sosnowskyi TaxID=360622 RepID=A0AAD8M977_9APIA|nr:hypothetical protein POM88_040887 [Heracleum sosnowskyi]
MITLSWNCRGVGLPSNVQFLTDVGFEGLVAVDPQGRSGGIALLWKEENNARLLGYSRNHIDIEISVAGMQPWRLTGLYGEPDRAQRKKTWDLLRHLARDSNLPWCVD